MKTVTLKFSAITFLMAVLTLGFSSCPGGGQGNAEFTDGRLAEFRVNGNCSMCKNRIEAAAASVKGVSSAEWNSRTKMVEIAMVQGTDLHEVHMAIAKAGHDTDLHRAADEAYNNLHTCCKYERE
jgi:periplasmic mercuric ion binding protein